VSAVHAKLIHGFGNNTIRRVKTSKATVFAERILAHFGSDGYFAFIAGSELDGGRSRKSDVIHFALNTLNPARAMPAVMIGDREHDIIGARDACVHSVGVTYGYGTRAELERSGAERIAESVGELTRWLLSAESDCASGARVL
jgi:phosphoglycolate phosphatase